jgi:hypothetical protein
MSRTQTVAPDIRDRSLASLADSLDTETRLLRQLAEILREQRDGVAADDTLRVDDSVHATHRVIQTLGEARSRRNMLVQVLTDRPEIPLTDLGDALGEGMTEDLRERQRALEELARSVSRDVNLNRIILEKALHNGEEYARRLLQPTANSTYGGHGEPNGGAGGPLLINQRV